MGRGQEGKRVGDGREAQQCEIVAELFREKRKWAWCMVYGILCEDYRF